MVVIEGIVQYHHVVHAYFLVLLLVSTVHEAFLRPHIFLVFKNLLVYIESIHGFIHRVFVQAHALDALIMSIHLFWTRLAQVTASLIVEGL